MRLSFYRIIKVLWKHLNPTQSTHNWCGTAFKFLAEHKVVLEWIPGHHGIADNHKVDVLEKRGTQMLFIRPEPLVGVGIRVAKTAVKNWLEKNLLRRWQNYLARQSTQ